MNQYNSKKILLINTSNLLQEKDLPLLPYNPPVINNLETFSESVPPHPPDLNYPKNYPFNKLLILDIFYKELLPMKLDNYPLLM